MSTITYSSQIRPATTEAAAATVAHAYTRLFQSVGLLAAAFRSAQANSRSLGTTVNRSAREVLARRRDAQKVLDLARRYDTSQPGFASDLRCAAFRAMDEA